MSDDGFTLMELIVAVFVVSVMTAVVLPHLVGISDRANHVACEQNEHTIKSALTEYYLIHDSVPAGDTDLQLQALVQDGLLQSVPAEPSGGVYTINDSDPNHIEVDCSVHGKL